MLKFSDDLSRAPLDAHDTFEHAAGLISSRKDINDELRSVTFARALSSPRSLNINKERKKALKKTDSMMMSPFDLASQLEQFNQMLGITKKGRDVELW
jgi:hypothetical protein